MSCIGRSSSSLTNPGIGRGYFDEKAHADLTRWMCNRFEAEGAAIARDLPLPLSPSGIGEYRRDHPSRKPKPGMILQTVSDLRLDPARCVIVGDQMSDIEAGAAAGLGLRILVGSRPCQNGRRRVSSHEVVADLREALALLRSRFAVAAAD